jgi:hypothetical protein
MAIEYENGRVLAILIHPGCHNDTKILDEMMKELKKTFTPFWSKNLL